MSLIGRVIGRTEDKVMEKFLAKYLAGFFERTCGSYITTIIGIGIMVLGAVNQFGAFIPTQYHALVNVAVLVLTAMLGILAHDSKDDVTIPLVKPLAAFVICLLVFGISSDAHAQTAPPVAANLPSNVYSAGLSYNVGGSPSIAGTAMYSHLLADGGTYGFTVIDFLPNTQPKFVVTTNVGAGVAQKVATIANIPVYASASAGLTVTGSNTGWNWSSGGTAVFSYKDNYKIMPNVRFVKTSVSGGTGYQPIVGVMFGWGQ